MCVLCRPSNCSALLNSLISWAPNVRLVGGCHTDLGGLLRRVRNRYACDKWLEDGNNTAADIVVLGNEQQQVEILI